MSSTSPSSTCEGVIDICVHSLMSEIRNYTEDQLQTLLGDEARLNAMIDAMPQVSALSADKELKLAQSKSLAECNLSLEPKLKEVRARLEGTYSEAVGAKQEVETLKAQLDSISESRSLDTVSALLQAAAQEAEDQSEAIADRFQSGEIDVDKFIHSFGEKRVLSHTRKVKAEKLAEILRQQQYNQQQEQQQVGAVAYPTYPGGAYGGGGGARGSSVYGHQQTSSYYK